jgi:hypothetical protein
MTTYTSLRTALVTLLETVTDVGMVHGRERFVVDPSKFLDMFKTTISGTVQIRAWLILRESMQPIEDTVFGESRQRHVFVLRGILGFQDSADTYGTLQALVDTIIALLDNQTTLSVSGTIVRRIGPCSLRSFEVGQFGSVLAHVAEIEVPIDTMTALGTA